MEFEIEDLPIFPYQVIETIGESGMIYTTLLNYPSLLEIYKDINIVAGELHKLIALQIVVTEKTYSPEEGDDFMLTLTERGMRMLKNHCHKQASLSDSNMHVAVSIKFIVELGKMCRSSNK